MRADLFARRPTSGDPAEIRPDAVRLTWAWRALPAADGHELTVRFGCAIRAAAGRAERECLLEALLSDRDEATLASLAAHFEQALKSTAGALAADQPAQAAIDEPARGLWQKKLTAEANRVAFAAGLEVLAPFELAIASPTLGRQRTAEAASRADAERAAQRLARLKHTGELLQEIETLRHNHPGMPADALLNRLDEPDQGEALTAMLTGQRGTAATIWAAAGQTLLRVTVTSDGLKTTHINATGEALGPLRSATPATLAGRDVLLLGGRAGVMLADRDGQPRRFYAAQDATSPLGFSSALIDRTILVARHGGLGLIAWPVEGDETARVMASEAQLSAGSEAGSGQLALLDAGRYLVSSGPRLTVVSEEGVRALECDDTAAVIALIGRDSDVLAVRADGAVDRVERDRGAISRVLAPRGRVTAAAGLAVCGSTRILLAGEDNVVRCIGLEDSLVSEYRSAHAGLRMLAATGAWVTGVSGDRERLIVWAAHDGRHPAGEIHVTAVARHRIAGLAIA